MPVPEAESTVAPWRRRYDWSAALGVPAHITVLAPFLAPGEIRPEVVARLAAACSRLPPLEVVLADVAEMGGAACLLPARDGPLRHLTGALVKEWPQLALPEERVYHLTVARGAAAVDDAVRALRTEMPIRAVCRDLVLFERRQDRAHELGRFAFSPG